MAESANRESHTGLFIGLGCLALSVGPLVLFGVLQMVGFFPGNNGLGLGLWMTFTAPFAFLIFIVGAIHSARDKPKRREGRGVLPL